MTNVERVALHRQRERLGLRPVQVLVSEQEIDFLLARDYELTRTDDRSIGSAVSAFLSDSFLEGANNLSQHFGRSCLSLQRIVEFAGQPRDLVFLAGSRRIGLVAALCLSCWASRLRRFATCCGTPSHCPSHSSRTPS